MEKCDRTTDMYQIRHSINEIFSLIVLMSCVVI